MNRAAWICSLSWSLRRLVALWDIWGMCPWPGLNTPLMQSLCRRNIVPVDFRIWLIPRIKAPGVPGSCKASRAETHPARRRDSFVLSLFRCCPACGLKMARFQHAGSNVTFSTEINLGAADETKSPRTRAGRGTRTTRHDRV